MKGDLIMMKKWIALLLAMLLMVPSFGLAQGKVLNILSWEGYVDADTLAAFEAETGIDVIWSPMDSIDSMLLKVTQGGGSDYDLILSSDYSLVILRQEGKSMIKSNKANSCKKTYKPLQELDLIDAFLFGASTEKP